MKKDKKTGDRRGTNPKSLANLCPAQFGDVRNPSGINGRRPYTQAIQECSIEPLPELVRFAMNAEFKNELYTVLKRIGRAKVKSRDNLPDLYEKGITWAKASARKLNLNAAYYGHIRAAIEIREAVEGRATARVEFVSQNDKLEELLAAFRMAAGAAGATQPEETTPVSLSPPM